MPVRLELRRGKAGVALVEVHRRRHMLNPNRVLDTARLIGLTLLNKLPGKRPVYA